MLEKRSESLQKADDLFSKQSEGIEQSSCSERKCFSTKVIDVPCHHKLEQCLTEYIEAAQIGEEKDSLPSSAPWLEKRNS